MARYIEMEGDRWVATVDRQTAHPGMHALVFNCVSDSQRPYRVVEIPAEESDQRTTPEFSERELRELFGNTQTMDFSYDHSAEPGRHGDGRWHLD